MTASYISIRDNNKFYLQNDSGRVAILGGGGSGHEPFTAGLFFLTDFFYFMFYKIYVTFML